MGTSRRWRRISLRQIESSTTWGKTNVRSGCNRRMTMTLGFRSRRSRGARLAAGAALLSMMLGQLRLTYAGLAPGAAAPQGLPAAQGQPAPQGMPAPAKLPTDLPWALATAIRPTKVKVLAGGADEAAVWRLFDGRSATTLEPAGRPARFRLELAQPTYLDAIAVYGRAAGALSVEAEASGDNKALLDKASLATGDARWNRRDFKDGPLTGALVVTFEPSALDAALPELELWGRPASAPQSP